MRKDETGAGTLLRPFAPADLGRLIEWLDQAGLGIRPGMSRTVLVRRLVKDPAILCRTLELRGAILGFFRLDLGPDRVAEVTLLVDPTRLRQGIGTQLVELAIGEARRRRLKRLIAVVHEQNRRAQRFFESVGFEPTGIEVPGFVHLARLIHQAESAAPLEIQP